MDFNKVAKQLNPEWLGYTTVDGNGNLFEVFNSPDSKVKITKRELLKFSIENKDAVEAAEELEALDRKVLLNLNSILRALEDMEINPSNPLYDIKKRKQELREIMKGKK